MEHSFLTSHKRSLLFRALSCIEFPKFSYVNPPRLFPIINHFLGGDVKLYEFKYCDAGLLLIISCTYKSRGVLRTLNLTKFDLNWSKETLQREGKDLLKKRFHKKYEECGINQEQYKLLLAKILQTMEDSLPTPESFGFSYIDAQVTDGPVGEEFSKMIEKPIQTRIDSDIVLGAYDEEETKLLFGKSHKDIELNKEYNDLDFGGLLGENINDLQSGGWCFELNDSYCHFTAPIEQFDESEKSEVDGQSETGEDEQIQTDDTSSNESQEGEIHSDESDIDEDEKNNIVMCFEKLKELMSQSWIGCERAWYGYSSRYLFDNYVLILKNKVTDKFACFVYTVDDASCAGFQVEIRFRVYETLNEVWRAMELQDKVAIAKYNLLPNELSGLK